MLRSEALQKYSELMAKTDKVNKQIEDLRKEELIFNAQMESEILPKHWIGKELIISNENIPYSDDYRLKSLELLNQGYLPTHGYMTHNLYKHNRGKAAKVFSVTYQRIDVIKRDRDNTSGKVLDTYIVWKLFANPMKADGTYGVGVITTLVFDKID